MKKRSVRTKTYCVRPCLPACLPACLPSGIFCSPLNSARKNGSFARWSWHMEGTSVLVPVGMTHKIVLARLIKQKIRKQNYIFGQSPSSSLFNAPIKIKEQK
jgi:hypothetical protein